MCQTNHALDQLLRHVAAFEPEFVRLGGRSKDVDVIKKRTLFEVRQLSSKPRVAGGLRIPALKAQKALGEKMCDLLLPMGTGKIIDLDDLERLGLLSSEQYKSFNDGDTQWVSHNNKAGETTPLFTWLGDVVSINKRTDRPEDFGFEYEEADLEIEQLKELEAEAVAQDDDDLEALKGPSASLANTYTVRQITSLSDDRIEALLKKQDVWRIPYKPRGSVFNYLQRKAKEKLASAFRQEAAKYSELAVQRRIGGWEEDHLLLKTQKIIGMTTTGLSKYRPLISSLKPKVVLTEEAAETLEAPVIAA
ncbi:hypothetical protein LTS18_001818, partial [Coniosporium uncinatum]